MKFYDPGDDGVEENGLVLGDDSQVKVLYGFGEVFFLGVGVGPFVMLDEEDDLKAEGLQEEFCECGMVDNDDAYDEQYCLVLITATHFQQVINGLFQYQQLVFFLIKVDKELAFRVRLVEKVLVYTIG